MLHTLSNRKVWLTLIFALLTLTGLRAQTIDVSGEVTDVEGEPIIGAIVKLSEDATKGASTSIDGTFTLRGVPSDGTLIVSYIGMRTEEVPIQGRTHLSIVLHEDAEMLGEVVVTALGIKREKRSLGYALQEVKGEDLMKTREANIANSLTGKVAGLQVVKGGGGFAGSSKIVLRGNNSLTGDNQPLIVVDGVPMDNFTGASNNDFWNPSLDMGNGLGDLNPNDIASMSVLKGASAAALYGSRAGNGVILITTKTGSSQQGLGVSVNSTTGFETIFMTPKVQTVYGQGSYGVFDPESTNSWGPRLDGTSVKQWNGEDGPLQYYNNVDGFLRTGINTQNSIALSRSVGNGSSVYASLTHTYNRDMTPESRLNRLNMITRFVSRFGANDAWTVDAKVQYIRSDVHNRPISGNRSDNYFSTLISMPGNVDITSLSAATDEYGRHLWYEAHGLNPYWATQYYNNDDVRDRFLMSGSVKYAFTDWASLELRGGADMYTTNRNEKMWSKGPIKPNGSYSVHKDVFSESNLGFLFSAGKDEVLGGFGFHGTLGGNLMYRDFSSVGVTIGELAVPDLFSINNTTSNPTLEEGINQHKINSLYGTFQVNYGGFFYLDLTGRNDWSSTLSKENRSFFYPSISTSFIFSDLIRDAAGESADWLTFAKVRASYASVGNDMGPYQLYNTYAIKRDPNGNIIASKDDVLFDSNVKNELINSWEVGLEARFLDSRLGFDFAFYKSNAVNQLLNIPVDGLSGYKYKKINAGDIENKGFELMVNAIPVETKDVTWDITANFSKNVNTVNELAEGVSQYSLGAFDNISILAAAGERYGVIYGSKFARVEDENSPYNGKVIVDANGIPTAAPGQYYLGNQQPDFLLGLTNTLRYRDFSLSFQIDGRFGGKIFSFSNYILKLRGRSAETLGEDGERGDFIYDGVRKEGDSYVPNDVKVKPQDYWTGIATGNVGITEDNLFDATNIRLRNVSLDYNLPASLLENTVVRGARIGVSANNLWMIYSKMNGVDPESVYATGSNAVGLEAFAPPTTRSFYINLSINF